MDGLKIHDLIIYGRRLKVRMGNWLCHDRSDYAHLGQSLTVWCMVGHPSMCQGARLEWEIGRKIPRPISTDGEIFGCAPRRGSILSKFKIG
jgi:hypothetical protein